MILKIAKRTLLMLFATCLLLTILPTTILGIENQGIVIVGDTCGLEITVPKKATDLGNLNPGDKKDSKIKLKNKGTSDITVYIKTNILNEKTKNGGNLADVMYLGIKDGKDILADDLFRIVADSGNILIGTMAPGTSKTLDLSADLLGEGADNKYQGAYMKVNWTFTTQCSNTGGSNDDGGGGGNDKDRDKDKDQPNTPPEEIIIDDDPIPLGPNETPKPNEPGEIIEEDTPPKPNKIIIVDDKIPFGFIKMPNTGQVAPIYFYGAGVFFMILGLYLRKK